MRVLMAAVGSRGDIQPAFALALALRAAGHDVNVSGPPDFTAWARELGVPFAPAGDSIEALLKDNVDNMGANPIRVMRTMRRMFEQQVPVWFDRTLEAARGADAIVSANQFVSMSVAEHLGIPCIGVAYSPTMLRSSHHPPIMFPWQQMPRRVNATCWWLTDAGFERMARKPINASRARLGLAPVASAVHHIFDGAPYFLAADPVVAPPAPDWTPGGVTATGPWFYEDPAPLDREVVEFLEAGPPPVYVGFGSMITKDAVRMTRTILEGAGAGGRRLLLSKGWAGIGGGTLPPTVKVVHGPMPHAKLFPRVAAVVHHGGAGTTATALRAGVAQVIVPHIMDQFYYAHRLHLLALAPRGVPAHALTAKLLDSAIEATLALPSGPREAAKARLAAGDGARRAVALIEEMAKAAK